MLRMHDHLKYPYFVAFYENRVKVGLSSSGMALLVFIVDKLSGFRPR
jgi:hypothetical protein